MKRVLKRLLEVLATVLVLPCWLGYLLGSLPLGRDRAFPGWSQLLSLAPGLTGAYLRRAFYRLVLPRCGADSWIGFGTVFSHPTAEVLGHGLGRVWRILYYTSVKAELGGDIGKSLPSLTRNLPHEYMIARLGRLRHGGSARQKNRQYTCNFCSCRHVLSPY